MEITDKKAKEKEVEEQKQIEDFAELLEDYEYEKPKRGQILEGHIITKDEDTILVDVGAKRDAIIPSYELRKLDEELIENYGEGDLIPVFVTRTPVGDNDLLVSLERGIQHENWEEADKHFKEGELLELEIIGHNKGGLLVSFKNLQGFIPNSHIPALRRTHKIQQANRIKQDMIGEIITVKTIEVDRGKRRLIFSAREALDEQRRKRLDELEEGQVIEGSVVNIVNFGAFVDLGNGVDGLLHKSEIDWRWVNQPSDFLEEGEKIEVKVIEVDQERERVSLSRKALLPNPWDTIQKKYFPGEDVEVEVTDVRDFGAFARLPDGIQGLIPLSEQGYTAPAAPEDLVKKEEKLLVRITSINPLHEEINLSMQQVPLEKQLSWLTKRLGEEEGEDQEEAVEAHLEAEWDEEEMTSESTHAPETDQTTPETA